MRPQTTTEILAWLDEAGVTIFQWHTNLKRLHETYKTKPSADLEQVSTVAYHVLQYMQVLSIEALLGTKTSKLNEVLEKLPPEVLLELSKKIK